MAIEKNTTLAELQKLKNWPSLVYQHLSRLKYLTAPAKLYTELKDKGNRNFTQRDMKFIMRELFGADLQEFSDNYLAQDHPEYSARDLTQLANDLFLPSSEKLVRFMNVRHPFARLYSCWGDKFNYWRSEIEYSGSSSFIEKHNHDVKAVYLEKYGPLIEKFETKTSKQVKGELSVCSFEAFAKCVAAKVCHTNG